MTAMTIRQLPDDFKHKLRERAAKNGRSMEAEARDILVDAVSRDDRVDLSWVDGLLEVGELMGEAGYELVVPPRSSSARVPEFDS